MQLSDELRSYLEQAPFAALCVALDLGHGREAVLVVKSTGDLLESLRAAAAPVDTGWAVEETPHGPVVCLLVRCAKERVGELLGEIYFDAASPDDREMLELFGSQAVVRAVFLDEDAKAVWSAEVGWDEVRRLHAEQVADRAEELLERAEACDFAAARIAFQEQLPLDRLVARAFPDPSTS